MNEPHHPCPECEALPSTPGPHHAATCSRHAEREDVGPPAGEKKSGAQASLRCPRCGKDVEPREQVRWVPNLDRVALCSLCPFCDALIEISE